MSLGGKNLKILGIDPSYKRTGFAVIENERLLYHNSLDLKAIETKKVKRKIIKEFIKKIEDGYSPNKIVIERARLFSKGFISMKTVIALGSLVSAVVDATDLDVYSVDSRSFKSRVIGSAKCSKDDVIRWVTFKFEVHVNEDEADAIAIAFYPFVINPLKDSSLLRKENN